MSVDIIGFESAYEVAKNDNGNFKISCSLFVEVAEMLVSVMAERDALREELRKAREQEPVAFVTVDGSWCGDGEPTVNIVKDLNDGDKLYASPVHAQKDYKIEDNHILFLAEKFMPSAFLATENNQILWFAKACIDADQPVSQPLIYDESEPNHD